MSSNSFGSLFRCTTFGESHGSAVGVVIDGCPAGLALDEEAINADLARRAPGNSPYTSPRRECDRVNILSGFFEGLTTGAPICLLIENGNQDSSKYEAIARIMRPGHANYTYLEKYGVFDYRGGGRASARETAARVAAGAVARQLLAPHGIKAAAWLSSVGRATPDAPIVLDGPGGNDWLEALDTVVRFARGSMVFAPDAEAEAAFVREIQAARRDGDSVGGTVTFVADGLPPGLGDPMYGRLDALLAAAMLSIPACKGFEIGLGFAVAALHGSDCNDPFTVRDGGIHPSGNKAGGVLGGISTGLPLYGRAAFKPTPSIFRPQASVDIDGREVEFALPAGSRHDPCVAVRAVPVVEAMCLCVLADVWLKNHCARVRPHSGPTESPCS